MHDDLCEQPAERTSARRGQCRHGAAVIAALSQGFECVIGRKLRSLKYTLPYLVFIIRAGTFHVTQYLGVGASPLAKSWLEAHGGKADLASQ